MGLSKSVELRLSDEKRHLKRALDESEARATEMEMNKRALEGEIQRLNMILTDKDTEIQVHQERCEALIRQIQVTLAIGTKILSSLVAVGSRGEMSIASTESRSDLSDLGQGGRGRIEFEDTRPVTQSDVVTNELSSGRSSTETGRHRECAAMQ